MNKATSSSGIVPYRSPVLSRSLQYKGRQPKRECCVAILPYLDCYSTAAARQANRANAMSLVWLERERSRLRPTSAAGARHPGRSAGTYLLWMCSPARPVLQADGWQQSVAVLSTLDMLSGNPDGSSLDHHCGVAVRSTPDETLTGPLSGCLCIR